jgi:hypothetical protein
MPEKTVEIVCLIQQGQEILCDDEEFVYERAFTEILFTRQLKKSY